MTKKSMEKIARWILARLEMFFVNSWILGVLPELFFFCCSYFKALQSLPPLQACSRTVLMNFWIFSPVTDGRTTALIVMVVVWYTGAWATSYREDCKTFWRHRKHRRLPFIRSSSRSGCNSISLELRSMWFTIEMRSLFHQFRRSQLWSARAAIGL